MHILWLCNIALPKIAQNLSIEESVEGGWMVGLSDYLLKQNSISLSVTFPINKNNQMKTGSAGGMSYYGFPAINKDHTKYKSKLEEQFKIILDQAKPDIIHIWGTEYPHTLAMVNACISLGIEDKVVISIQGLCSVYAKHYFASLPQSVIRGYSFQEFLRHDNIFNQMKKFKKRGDFEIKALQNVKNIIGRTTWDKACTSQINASAKYHFCNETLRDEFYKHAWSLDHCEKNSIFVSQGVYPIKGLHFILEAMPIILKRFPDARIYVAGQDIICTQTFMQKIKISSYGLYVKKLIRKYNLENNIIFTGILKEKQMSERYLKSNVFICPSSIENSPNSLGEAMILGVPSVASYVGGIPDMLRHGEEGFLYQADAPYELAHYICEILNSDEIAFEVSYKAREHAMRTHNMEVNSQRLLDIYNGMLGEEE